MGQQLRVFVTDGMKLRIETETHMESVMRTARASRGKKVREDEIEADKASATERERESVGRMEKNDMSRDELGQ